MSTFHVDLRGIVDLLSHHIYSSPRVYVRELLQNGVDAVTARRLLEPEAPAELVLELPSVTGDGTLRVTDTGVGLTAEEMVDLLSTIGRSSKRDEHRFARAEFLGQFGIGLLSCFLVADRIELRSRSARVAGAPTVRWRGEGDGSYTVDTDVEPLPAPGTEVRLTPRRGDEMWFRDHTVRSLAELYGSLLPTPVVVVSAEGRTTISAHTPPWRTGEAEQAEYCSTTFGFRPLATIPLAVPEAGLEGVAFVLPAPVSPSAPAAHRVYAKRMLLAESAEGLLPSWAFFVRCVVDTTELRPTASREALQEDTFLDDTREALGTQLREWLLRLAVVDPAAMRALLDVHRLGVKALAVHDDDMLALVRDHVPFETTAGALTLAEAAERFGAVRYTRTVDEFRSLSAVAGAQGFGLVNGGYVYDADLLERLATTESVPFLPLEPDELAARLNPVASAEELAARPLLLAATAALAGRDVEVVLRRFDPASLPALYLTDTRADGRAIAAAAEAEADPLWAEILGALPGEVSVPPRLVLNHANPLVRRLVAITDDALGAEVVRGLYVQALLQGRHPLQPADTAMSTASFLALVERALAAPG